MATNIVGRYSLHKIPSKQQPLEWQKRGLQYTRSGYGKKIPTATMVQIPGSDKWRRVYCAVFSNAGTCYVPKGKDWIVIED